MSAESSNFSPIFVESCVVRGFRGLDDCRVEFEPNLTVLVGRNNAGKSRILRAVAVGLGMAADIDDLTVGQPGVATIDLVLAPHPVPTKPSEDDAFGKRVAPSFGGLSQITREDPICERFAWRTTVRRSAEGLGARSEAHVLVYDHGSASWLLPASPVPVPRPARALFSAEVVDTRRDVAEDLTRRGSAIRRVLNDLEVDDLTREQLEIELASLGAKIVDGSASLAAVKNSLDSMDASVGGLGRPAINPLPMRLEELGRSVAIDLDTGSGALPIRLHGSGSRSLASLQIQGVNYERRLGRDGPELRPHPVTLVEEPEAHLHPQAELRLGALLKALPGQVIISTHSSHVVTSVEQRSIRLLRQEPNGTTVIDLGPVAEDGDSEHRALRPSTHGSEMEKLKRLIERPFGELLFASALVIGDGSTERAFLPIALGHALGSKGHAVCAVDPGSMKSELAHAAVKFAKLIGIPWMLFSDSDGPGVQDAKELLDKYAAGDEAHVVWITAGTKGSKGTAFEGMMAEFSDVLCRQACTEMRPDLDPEMKTLKLMKKAKGSVGAALAGGLIQGFPDSAHWPPPLVDLVKRLDGQI